MKVVIAGIRYQDPVEKIIYDDYPFVVKAVMQSGFEITEVISGHAIGVDRLGETYASVNNIPLEVKPADWNRFGKAAGPMRNKVMAELCDAAVIIWDGKSTGTYNMVQCMNKLKKPYHLVITSGSVEDFMK